MVSNAGGILVNNIRFGAVLHSPLNLKSRFQLAYFCAFVILIINVNAMASALPAPPRYLL